MASKRTKSDEESKHKPRPGAPAVSAEKAVMKSRIQITVERAEFLSGNLRGTAGTLQSPLIHDSRKEGMIAWVNKLWFASLGLAEETVVILDLAHAIEHGLVEEGKMADPPEGHIYAPRCEDESKVTAGLEQDGALYHTLVYLRWLHPDIALRIDHEALARAIAAYSNKITGKGENAKWAAFNAVLETIGIEPKADLRGTIKRAEEKEMTYYASTDPEWGDQGDEDLTTPAKPKK